MHRLLPFLLIPVFLSYGPNCVGYQTIMETDIQDENAIHIGDTMACNVVLGDDKQLWLVEGKLLMRQPLILLVDTPEMKNVPFPFDWVAVQFCLTTSPRYTTDYNKKAEDGGCK